MHYHHRWHDTSQDIDAVVITNLKTWIRNAGLRFVRTHKQGNTPPLLVQLVRTSKDRGSFLGDLYCGADAQSLCVSGYSQDSLYSVTKAKFSPRYSFQTTWKHPDDLSPGENFDITEPCFVSWTRARVGIGNALPNTSSLVHVTVMFAIFATLYPAGLLVFFAVSAWVCSHWLGRPDLLTTGIKFQKCLISLKYRKHVGDSYPRSLHACCAGLLTFHT